MYGAMAFYFGGEPVSSCLERRERGLTLFESGVSVDGVKFPFKLTPLVLAIIDDILEISKQHMTHPRQRRSYEERKHT